MQAGPSEYDRLPDGTLRARTFDPTPEVYAAARLADVPWLSGDVSFRPLRRLDMLDTIAARFPWWQPVGMFDPELWLCWPAWDGRPGGSAC